MKIKEFFFTGFYSGYFPVAPGTAGTVVGMAIYVLEYAIFGHMSWLANIIVFILFLFPSIKLCGEGEIFFGEKDPPQVVLDEMVGYWCTLLFHPFSWTIVIAGFIIFRFFDIVKPYPVGRIQNIKGGVGVLVDDVIAGLYANIVLILITIFVL